jgi:hypothetical protein
MNEKREFSGACVLVVDPDGPAMTTEREVVDLIGDAMAIDAALVAIPLARLPPAFLDLSSRFAGEVLQKFVNYRRRIAIVGDVSGAVAGSKALRDFVGESNRGRHVWFVADLAELEARLAG